MVAKAGPLLGLNQFTTMPQSFEADLDTCQELGITALELCQTKLSEKPDQALKQIEQIKVRGLRVCSVQSKVHSLFPDRLAPKPGKPEERMARFRDFMDLVTQVFPKDKIPFVIIGGAAPKQNVREAYITALKLIPELADYAAGKGCWLAYEAIHPYLVNFDTFTWSLDGADRLVQEIGRENVGLVCDCWHVWQESGITRRLQELARAGRIYIVHLSDWPKEGPRGLDDRRAVGDGLIDYPALLGALDAGGYSGPYVIELLSSKDLPDSLWKEDLTQMVKRNAEGFWRAWNARRTDAAAAEDMAERAGSQSHGEIARAARAAEQGH